MRVFCKLLLIGLLVAVPAFGDTLTVVAPAPVNQQYQQTENSPCIFGDPSCNQPEGFLYTMIHENGPSFNYGTPTPVQSPHYSGQQILDIVGTLGFMVGVDINQAGNNPPPLTYFAEYINGFLVASFGTAGADTGGTPLQFVNNGNGWADDLITGFVTPTASDTVWFELTYLDATDGAEQFFLISAEGPPPVIPEPASLILFGTGLLGLAAKIRRSKKRAS